MANWLNVVLKYEANYLTSENTQIQKIQKEKIKAMKRKEMNKNTTLPPRNLDIFLLLKLLFYLILLHDTSCIIHKRSGQKRLSATVCPILWKILLLVV